MLDDNPYFDITLMFLIQFQKNQLKNDAECDIIQVEERGVYMDLKNVTITEISTVVTVYSEKGGCDKIADRQFYGLSFCREGQITYLQNGRKYVTNKDSAILLPKGGTYFIQRDKTFLEYY